MWVWSLNTAGGLYVCLREEMKVVQVRSECTCTNAAREAGGRCFDSRLCVQQSREEPLIGPMDHLVVTESAPLLLFCCDPFVTSPHGKMCHQKEGDPGSL